MSEANTVFCGTKSKTATATAVAGQSEKVFQDSEPYERNEVSPGSEHIEPTRAKPVRRNIVSVKELQIDKTLFSERLEGVKQ